MHNRASREIFDYWVRLAGERPAPLRTEIDPVSLRRYLPHLFIAAMAQPGGDSANLTFRLAGTRICDMFGREFRGAAFEDLWFDKANGQALEIAGNAIQYERPVLLEVHVLRPDDERPYDLLLMPMRPNDEGFSDRLLGALLPRSEALAATATPAAGLLLDRWTFLDRDGRIPAAPTALAAGDEPARPSLLSRLLPAALSGGHR